jgi:hypothetical protein
MEAMNENEITQWMEDHKRIDSSTEHDGRGNSWRTEIYHVEGKSYAVGFCNGTVSRDIPYKRDSDPTYTPVEVWKTEVVRKETCWEYEPPKEDDAESCVCGETFTQNLTIIDEWESGGQPMRLVNLGAGPDQLQTINKDIGDTDWRPERSCYVHGVLCGRVKELRDQIANEH